MTAPESTSSISPNGTLDLPAFCRTGHDLRINNLPAGSRRVTARTATGALLEAETTADGGRPTARLIGLRAGTWSIQAHDAAGRVINEQVTTVGEHPGERPVHGFATSFGDADVAAVLAWHRALRSTVVQIYDWMNSYTEPAGPEQGWSDPGGRPVSLRALRSLATGLRDAGAVAHAYAPIYAVGHAYANAHPDQLMYDDEGTAILFMDQIVLANPANEAWQRHFAASYGDASDRIGFHGYHVDSYGYPRLAYTRDGTRLDMRAAYAAFLRQLRAERPNDLISFNQVNGVPAATPVPDGPGFRYCEVWPPNDAWRHFEGLMVRSATGLQPVGRVKGSLACYPRVWGRDEPTGPIPTEARPDALRTVVVTDAIATCLGASALLYGDQSAVLWDAYYPKNERLLPGEVENVLAWHLFGLRCRDLFLDGEDTSWYEILDDNGSVSVETPAPVYPEPIGQSVFARVVHGKDYIAVGIIDLTGSEHGRWSEPTRKGTIRSVTVRVHVGHPDQWRCDAAVLGASDDGFAPVPAREVSHRWGRALEVQVPLVAGWSILRVSNPGIINCPA